MRRGRDPARTGPTRTKGSPAPPHESRLYWELSRLYDIVLSRVFAPRATQLVRALAIPAGARVLELGVGTGASLSAYPRHCEVVGLDRSPEMLREARRKIRRLGWRHVRVVEGDAMALPFEDDAFDYVHAFHVVSVVPDPRRLMGEAVRVGRPGGVVAVVNHFRSAGRLAAKVERWLEPVMRLCGWGTIEREAVLGQLPLEVLGSRSGGPYGLFTAIVTRNAKADREP